MPPFQAGPRVVIRDTEVEDRPTGHNIAGEQDVRGSVRTANLFTFVDDAIAAVDSSKPAHEGAESAGVERTGRRLMRNFPAPTSVHSLCRTSRIARRPDGRATGVTGDHGHRRGQDNRGHVELWRQVGGIDPVVGLG